MAANDFYNPPAHHYHTSTNTPPPDHHSGYSVSPVTSPFDDHYSYSTTHSSGALGGFPDSSTSHLNKAENSTTHLTGPEGSDHSSDRQHNIFGDHNAIPLQNQSKTSRGSPTPYNNDPERFGDGVEKRRAHKKKEKKKGWFSGRIPWVVYLLTAIQIGVFVGELIKNGILTGSPIATKPSFNIMIGPSPYVLINMGARFTPCMHNIRDIIENQVVDWPCPNTTSVGAGTPTCSLSTLCGMAGNVPDQSGVTDFRDRSKEPNQWWRFITPIFLHAGIIHIGFNLLLQMTLGRDMEREIGPLRFAIVYFSAGIFGFVLGGNYAADGITSVGASGALFGILALTLLDLFFNWSSRQSPVKDLLFLLLDIAITFVLGLLPGLDNFSHIGGFLMGLILGICLLHSPQSLRRRTGQDDTSYATVQTSEGLGTKFNTAQFAKAPVGFFKGRKPLWWAWWLVRAGGLVAAFIGFILLLKNFYEWRNTCTWCKHLSCLPVTVNGVNWCNIGGLNLSNSTSGN